MAAPFAKARTSEIVVKDMGDEIVLFDKRTDTAHCLTPAAAIVWNASDGQTAPEAMIAKLAALGMDEPEALVAQAISDLSDKGLLEDTGVSRRVALRKIGAAAVSVPLVVSVLAPMPAHAQSGTLGDGALCTGPGQCGPGLICTAGTSGGSGTPTGLTYCSASNTCISSGTRKTSAPAVCGGNNNPGACCSNQCTPGTGSASVCV
jgi:hypothetical protein